MALISIARSNLRSEVQRASPHGHDTLPRARILVSTSLRQLFCRLQVTWPLAGLPLCKVEQTAAAHWRRTSRSFFSCSDSAAACVVGALASCAGARAGDIARPPAA